LARVYLESTRKKEERYEAWFRGIRKAFSAGPAVAGASTIRPSAISIYPIAEEMSRRAGVTSTTVTPELA
jgi:hypothetical protein